MNIVLITFLILCLIMIFVINVSFHYVYKGIHSAFLEFKEKAKDSTFDKNGVLWHNGEIILFKDVVTTSNQIPPIEHDTIFIPALWYYRTLIYLELKKLRKHKKNDRKY